MRPELYRELVEGKWITPIGLGIFPKTDIVPERLYEWSAFCLLKSTILLLIIGISLFIGPGDYFNYTILGI